MIKRKHILLLVSISILTSCTSYKRLKSKHFSSQDLLNKQWLDIQEFNIYTFNICESYKETIKPTDRFIKCPKNFFQVSAKDSVRKVEELYFLTHKESNLAIYMTTFSHKYIAKQKGFLNDSIDYKEKFYLRDTEYIYIGKIDTNKDSVLFERQKKKAIEKDDFKPSGDKSIIWHFNKLSSSNNLFAVEKVNIETVENVGSFDKKIALNEVFSIPFHFKLSKYKLLGSKSDDKLREIERVHFKENRKGYYDVIFKVKGLNEGYRFPSRKVLYFTK